MNPLLLVAQSADVRENAERLARSDNSQLLALGLVLACSLLGTVAVLYWKSLTTQIRELREERDTQLKEAWGKLEESEAKRDAMNEQRREEILLMAEGFKTLGGALAFVQQFYPPQIQPAAVRLQPPEVHR